MRKYDAYKDSGIEWIGEIPSHWDSSRYRYFYFSNMGVTLLKEDVKEDGIYPVYSATETDVLFGYVDEATVILNEGDIVIPARGNSIGHIKVVTSPSTSTQTTIYSKKISQNIETNFVKYFLQGLREHLFQFDRTAIPQITVNQVKNNPLVIPTPEEQTAIAAYLDRKTAEIDELIADKKRLLELYEEEKTAIINQAVTKGINPDAPMKDSGIEWLGEIPEGWEIPNMKYICKFILDGTHGSFPRVSNGYRLLSVRNIINNEFVFRDDDSMVSEEHFNEISKRFLVQTGDIQLAIVGATLGKVAVVRELPEKFVTQRSVATLRPNNRCLPEYLFYFIKTSNFQSYLWLNAGFSAQPGVYLGTIQNSTIPIPNIQEQRAIVRHIEAECARIDAKKAKTEKLIELLTEYRTALISEVVTGKIKVI